LSISSMTGFARAQGQAEDFTWAWEAKSVNGKGREIRFRLPSGFEFLEVPARDRAIRIFHRGNIFLNLTVKWERPKGGYRVNTEVLDYYLSVLPHIHAKVPNVVQPSADGLLSLRGVIETEDEEPDEASRRKMEEVLLSGLDDVLGQLLSMRDAEGGRLEEVLRDQLNSIAESVRRAGDVAATQPEAIRERLKNQIETLLEDASALNGDRLAQEAALLMTKADIREELDRLGAHVSAASDLLNVEGSVGRKLDFLCQEFNREANTLCSKSTDVDLTRIGLDLKATIDQLREQVQNIE